MADHTEPGDTHHTHDEQSAGGHTHSHDGHTHSHPHPHGEVNPEQAQLGPSDPGTVMVDIGGDIGALILLTPESMVLDEIDISPVGEDDNRTHVAIRERRSPAGTQWAAIYPHLQAGAYTLWDQQNRPATRVTIVGGEVAQVDWR